jgi:hypothetical protein
MGGGTVGPDNLYEVPLVKREGGVTRIKAHGVKEIVGVLPTLDLTPAKKAFINVPENEIIVPKGAVQLLVGLGHRYLHPIEVERTGSLALFLSFFGVRTGWIVAGNLAEGAKGTVFVGAIRQRHYVPLDFLSAEALGTETLMCSMKEVQRVPIQSEFAYIQRKC